uniref:Uncharacterized protein n=1 Tax=uncultured prokaryote TaxID=198431 RepID=A0A0H5Q838_9ZZZZ|nr:hypothetical protein [uncultured prokaryote]
MGIPELFVQSMIVAPQAIKVRISIAWNAQASHSVCTVRVTEGADDILLASSTGSCADLRNGQLLKQQLHHVVENAIDELELLTKRSEPF